MRIVGWSTPSRLVMRIWLRRSAMPSACKLPVVLFHAEQDAWVDPEIDRIGGCGDWPELAPLV